MPDKITLDDALTTPQQGQQRITVDEALSNTMSQAQPILQQGRREGGPFALVPDPVSGQLLTVPAPGPPERTNFVPSLLSAIPADQQTQMRVLAKQLFPNDPNAEQRVGVFDGVPVYVDDAGQLRKVSSGLTRFGANLVANTPEIAGTIGGAMLTANPITGGAIGGAVGRGAKRGLSALIFDEPVTPGSVGKEMAGEAALNLVTGGTGKLGVKALDRGKVLDYSPTNLSTAEQARDHVKRTTGIDLDLAQASGDAKLIALRNYAARHPGKSAQVIQAANEASLGQFDQATNRVLDLVSHAAPADFLGQQGVNAATLVIKAAREKVYNEVRPLYDAAYAAVPVVDKAMPGGEAILDFLKLPYFQEAFHSGQKLRSLETGSAMKPRTRATETLKKGTDEEWESTSTTVSSTPTEATQITSRVASGSRETTEEGVLTKRKETVQRDIVNPSLAELDYTKRGLDEMIEKLMMSGHRQRAAALLQKKNEFVAALDALSNDQWQLARRHYEDQMTRNVKPLEDGPVGVLAGIKYSKNATAAARIFSDPNMTPEQIAMTKAVLYRQEPAAYNGLVRTWLAQQYNKALKETQAGAVVNPAGKFRQMLYGTPQAKARTQAMLPADAADALDDLMLAAQKLASTPIRGSDTAFNMQITEQLKRTALGKLRWLSSPIATTKGEIKDAAEQRALDKNIEALTEALIDPGKRKQLRQIVRMSDPTKQAIQLSSMLSGQVAATGVSTAFGDEERLPPAVQKLREAFAR